MAIASLAIIADEYSPYIRIGYVEITEDEFLKETFDVKAVPGPFYMRKGRAYEMGAFMMAYVQY